MGAIETLLRQLQGARGDWGAIRAVFSDHVASPFLNDFVAREIGSLARDFDNVTRMGGIGPTTFTFINTTDFEYSVRILAPLPPRPHPVKWQGMRQIIGVKVGGPVAIRKLTVPNRVKINSFELGVRLEGNEVVIVADGDMVANDNVHHLLDIYEVSSPSIVEILTERQNEPELMWTFDQDLRSLYSEQSSLTVSRLSNVLELAHILGKPIPDDILNLALDPSKPYVALLTIRSMLAAGHPDAFIHLHRAIDSRSETLSQGAQHLLDSMTTRGGVYAT